MFMHPTAASLFSKWLQYSPSYTVGMFISYSPKHVGKTSDIYFNTKIKMQFHNVFKTDRTLYECNKKSNNNTTTFFMEI
jgi:hypothetical protein